MVEVSLSTLSKPGVGIKPTIEKTATRIKGLLKSPIEYVRPINEKEKEFLVNLIGQKPLDLIQAKGLTIYYYPDRHGRSHFYFEYNNRVLTITPEPERGQKAISLDFLFTEDFQKLLREPRIFQKIRRSPFEKVKRKIERGTLDFFKLVDEVLSPIDEDCEIYLLASTKRRERLYERLLARHQKENVHILPAKKEDRKKPKRERGKTATER